MRPNIKSRTTARATARTTARWATICLAFGAPAQAEDLFRADTAQSLATDRRAAAVGDGVTIIIVQAAESSSTLENGSRKSSSLTGSIQGGGVSESGGFSLGGSYAGRGEVRRSERFVTQMTASVATLYPNGDLGIEGAQRLDINGETTAVRVRGRVRRMDIDAQNRVPSNRIADAQIDYNGRGYVTRSARPGLITRIFGFLGLM